ncbi:MAG TPA: HypC/HybG/HupF family hydrogenase formation chaperone [Desulfovibrio sp.]|jgi:hydrogenase expression/formation protein HypC|nr:HypC/HybG/HupF family hydrogenase formation chaperone [Desulfovibrio sp.]
MCLAVPAEIIEIKDGVATCRVGEGQTLVQASLMLLENEPQLGDFLIIHAGFALRVLDRQEAEENLKLLRDVIQASRAAGVEQDML